jgi:hypothetical protein
MRIKKDSYNDCELYSCDLKERVAEVFRATSHISEIRSLLDLIKKESVNLREIFLTEEELKENKKIASDFDAKVQGAVYSILKYLDTYQKSGWRELVYEGDNSDERVNKAL